MKRRSLVFTSSIMISLLLLVLVGIMTSLMYNAERGAAYDEFEQVGFKLKEQAQANNNLISVTGAAIEAGREAPANEMLILKKLLDKMTDDDLITNAYYITPEIIEKDGKTYLRNLQISESLIKAGSAPGEDIETIGALLKGFEQAKKDNNGLTAVYEDRFGKWITYMAQIKGEDGKTAAVFGLDFNYGKVEANMNKMLWKTIGIGIVIDLIGIALIVLLTRAVLKPLRVLAVTAKEAAQGNLTVHVPVTSSNEIGQAASSFNEMIASLRKLTIQIERTSREVAESSGSLKDAASQTASATHEITDAIQHVASGSETQLISSQECQRAMTEMVVGIQRIADSATVVSDLASDTSVLAENGGVIIDRTIRQMMTIEEHVHNAADAMSELNQSNVRIEDILSHISEVANQTNLLALNASIEAARAGEHGKGFGVVAQEIRKLAERSKESSDEITSILHTIGERSREVASSLTSTTEEAQVGTKLAGETGESFRAILDSVKQVSEQVQEVSAASEQMSAGSEQIAASLDELERMAEGSASHSQEVAAASEEQLASVEEVVGASEQLRSLATELRAAVGRFKV
ncbi:methyl-accepting chemotaxis protein [Paenibacillus curdlanolyticus]